MAAALWWADVLHMEFIFRNYINEHNSELIIVTFISALVGTYGGQFVAEKKHDQRLLIEEFRATNTALMIANGIFNSLINIRKQFSNKFWNSYYEHKAEYAFGPQVSGEIFNFNPNLITFQNPKLPIDELKKILFEKITLSGRPIAVVTALGQTIDNLESVFAQRNSMVLDWKNNQRPIEIFMAEYFGTPLSPNMTDMTFVHLVDGIYNLVETAQFFSMLLSNDLRKHASILRDQIKAKGLRIYEIKYDTLEKDLLPKEENYQQWINNFKKLP